MYICGQGQQAGWGAGGDVWFCFQHNHIKLPRSAPTISDNISHWRTSGGSHSPKLQNRVKNVTMSLWDCQYGTVTKGPSLWDRHYGTVTVGPTLWDCYYGTVTEGLTLTDCHCRTDIHNDHFTTAIQSCQPCRRWTQSTPWWAAPPPDCIKLSLFSDLCLSSAFI